MRKGLVMNSLALAHPSAPVDLLQPVAELAQIFEGKYSLTRRCSGHIEQVVLGMLSSGLNLEDAQTFVDDILDNIEFDE